MMVEMCLLLLCSGLGLLAQFGEPANGRFNLPDARLVDGEAKILKGYRFLWAWSRASMSRFLWPVHLFEKCLARLDLARDQAEYQVLPELTREVELEQKLQAHLAWAGNRGFYPAAQDMSACLG